MSSKEPLRMRPVRFEIHEGDNGPYIDDDDFKFDALIKVSADFGCESAERRYMQAVCDALNAADIPHAYTDEEIAEMERKP